jgi:secondary thiamine-phosphate synthase enzyme
LTEVKEVRKRLRGGAASFPPFVIASRAAFARKWRGTFMKSHRKELWFDIRQRREFVNITPKVAECVRESGVREGLCLVNAMHISASVFINDDESGLHQDFETWLEKLAPEKPHAQYRHNGYEDNADAHLKRTIMGREVVVAVTNGELDFGPWEQIFYGEFDGKRRKRVLVKIIGE